jgi:hypothetical protein
MTRDQSVGQTYTLEKELHEALVGTVLRLGRVAQRFTRHRRRYGFDAGCRRLLDEFRLSRSLALALAEEARSYRRVR